MGKSRFVVPLLGVAACALATACVDLLGVTELGEAGPVDGAASDATVGTSEGGTGVDAPGEAAPLSDDATDGFDALTDGGAPDGATAADAGTSGDSGLTVSPSAAHLVRGSTFDLSVALTPPPSSGSDPVTVTGLPAGVSVSTPLTLTGSAPQGTLTLSATAGATLGPASVSVSAGGATAPLSLVVADPAATLDTTFNQGGVQVFVPAGGTTGAAALAVVALADGSVVLGGCAMGGTDSGWALAKLTPAGTPDTTFATNVSNWNPHLSTTGCIHALAVNAQGTLLAAGDDASNIDGEALVRALNSDGTIHLAFQGSGSWQLGATGNSNGTYASGVAWAPNGDAYVAINPRQPGGFPPSAYVERVEASGGQMQAGAVATTATLFGIGVDPRGDVVTGGLVNVKQFYAIRITPSGVDSTFGGDGGAFGPASADLYASTAVEDTEGGIYVGGAGTGGGQTPVLGHINAAGRADLGTAGWVAVTVNNVPGNSGFVGLAVQSDGRVLGVGYGASSTDNYPWLVRTTADGVLDPAFNDGGVTRIASAAGITYSSVAVFPPPDGRIVVAGTEPGVGFYAARFWP